jgi:gamma-glutamylcyclotransferase (GGCT)/AIG2-like uncharacterized protein YtfP
MSDACFAYGSLMYADIMARVCGRTLAGVPASLAGYRRAPVRDEDYPGLVAAPGGRVTGVLYRGLPAEAWTRLDAFEGEMYRRARVRVECADGGAEAWAYLVRDEYAGALLAGDWDAAAFQARGKARFEARYMGFAAIETTP